MMTFEDESLECLYQQMLGSELEPWIESLRVSVKAALSDNSNSKIKDWRKIVEHLPVIESQGVDLDAAAITILPDLKKGSKEYDELYGQLKQLMPWRKGPYSIHGVYIDTEWRSDFKWQRLVNEIAPLKSRRILDVGCGNGYHGWRMMGEGAELVIGIDPSPLFFMQFSAIKHFAGKHNIFHLPVGIEALPDNLRAFDTVFSMGVFYHRRSPIDHLIQLRQALRAGGQLVLETLVIEGDENTVLLPNDRYAQMRNVWFLPSSKAIQLWLRRCGFNNVRLVDETATGFDEQRSTDWMQFHSLQEFLDPDDQSRTVEGYPAPVRAVFVADAP